MVRRQFSLGILCGGFDFKSLAPETLRFLNLIPRQKKREHWTSQALELCPLVETKYFFQCDISPRMPRVPLCCITSHNIPHMHAGAVHGILAGMSRVLNCSLSCTCRGCAKGASKRRVQSSQMKGAHEGNA